MNHLLRQQNLAAEIRNDVLFISTLKKQSQFLVCHSYRILKGADAGELAKEISSKSAPDSWSAAAKRLITINYDVRDLALAADSSAIAKILTHTVQPASWSEVGGLGKIAAADGELSITQTVQIHRTIETWLADLRTALKPAAAEK